MTSTSPRRLKSARHHWWPRCVSKHWVGHDSKVGRLTPDGSVRRVSASSLGSISNAHLIRLDPEGGTFWDQDFEGEFSQADAMFPGVIQWLEDIRATSSRRAKGEGGQYGYTEIEATQQNLRDLAMCLISLAVRSPSNRASVASMVKNVRDDPNIPSWEIDSLVGANIRDDQKRLSERAGEGKFAILLSKRREFIFGDGFHHNVRSPVQVMSSPRMIVPVTPMTAVIYVVPRRWRVDPRLVLKTLTIEEVEWVNYGVQVHSKSEIFFRSEKPSITDAFRDQTFQRFRTRDNVVDNLIDGIPGVHDHYY